ncbi:MAG: hypothetical protein FJ137_20280 [Deltaproteobacteria bacterium]|nr:hypothetical protein [Deltaproteobacteria bacterium]
MTVVARHAPRIHRFDNNPEWLGPKAMSTFSRARDGRDRRRLIASARHRGSRPPEIASDLRRELRCGSAKWLEAGPVSADPTPAGVRLRLDCAPHAIEVDRVARATGFEVHHPGGGRRGEETIDRLGLPCAKCGYPLVSPSLGGPAGSS